MLSVTLSGYEQQKIGSVKQIIQGANKQQEQEAGYAESLKHMFKDGKVSGRLRVSGIGYQIDNSEDNYATAVGGNIKYALATWNGFGGGVRFSTAYDVDTLSGEGVHHNSEYASSDGDYITMSEAYIDFSYDALTLRAGRQSLDTPLVDTDDIRIVANSFNGYTATYKIGHVEMMAGYLDEWQGSDADLDGEWIDMGDGVAFGGATLLHENLDANLWYYNMSGSNNSLYLDITGHLHIDGDEVVLNGGVQYLHQNELAQSGIDSQIYGAIVELAMPYLTWSISANKAQRYAGKESFSGFGGGTLFTNMDSMILDVITRDRAAQSYVTNILYRYKKVALLGAVGRFDGTHDSLGQKEQIVEYNVGCTYDYKDVRLGIIYINEDNQEHTQTNDGSWQSVRASLVFDF